MYPSLDDILRSWRVEIGVLLVLYQIEIHIGRLPSLSLNLPCFSIRKARLFMAFQAFLADFPRTSSVG